MDQRRSIWLTAPLKKAWHPDADKAPAFVIWNGSFGYDIATIGIKQMYQNLKESVAGLCKYEQKKGGNLFIGFEPKPNEGHPAMLIPTVASALCSGGKSRRNSASRRETRASTRSSAIRK